MTCSLHPRDAARAGEGEDNLKIVFLFLVPLLLKCSELFREWVVRRLARRGVCTELPRCSS